MNKAVEDAARDAVAEWAKSPHQSRIVVAMRELRAALDRPAMIGPSVSSVQSRLPEYWTDQSYPDSFNGAPLPHRHYNHALTHAMKALGGLAALSDALDHERVDQEMEGYRSNAGKWLADLVICAARMSEQIDVNLSDATAARIQSLIDRWGGK